MKNLKEFVETVCLSEKRLWFISILYDRFLAAGYNVVGISRDSVKAQKNFSDKNALPFPLLSDPDASIIKAFGAWGEKKLYGKTCEGILRKTFIFNEKGELVEIIDK